MMLLLTVATHEYLRRPFRKRRIYSYIYIHKCAYLTRYLCIWYVNVCRFIGWSKQNLSKFKFTSAGSRTQLQCAVGRLRPFCGTTLISLHSSSTTHKGLCSFIQDYAMVSYTYCSIYGKLWLMDGKWLIKLNWLIEFWEWKYSIENLFQLQIRHNKWNLNLIEVWRWILLTDYLYRRVS